MRRFHAAFGNIPNHQYHYTLTRSHSKIEPAVIVCRAVANLLRLCYCQFDEPAMLQHFRMAFDDMRQPCLIVQRDTPTEWVRQGCVAHCVP